LASPAPGDLIDRALGIETARIVDHADLEFGPEAGGRYVATPWPALLHLWRVLRGLGIIRDDVFVDYGSGKGRALLVAAMFPFKRLIGVERSPALNRVAAANLRAARLRPRAEVDLVTADARAFVVPPDATVLYFYNPFKHDVFAAVVGRILASLAASPRTITIIYTNPVMHDHLIARGFVMSGELGDTRVYTNGDPGHRF
jgi:SAM-dependent methyltransferase